MIKTEPDLDIRILCDTRLVPKHRDARKLRPCWTAGEPKIDALLQALKEQAPARVVIQHHPALLPWPALCTLLSRQSFPEARFVLTLHNTREIDNLPPHLRSRVITALGGVDVLLVHTLTDHYRLQGLGVQATLFPHGAPLPATAHRARRLDPGSPVIIGCFGFFFPHKRIALLMEAVARLRTAWPQLRLRLVNAEFPRDDSRLEVLRCRSLAIRLALYNNVEWFTKFTAESDALRLLSETDLIVLPYADTPESASGALHFALASGAPVAVSDAAIFDEAESAVLRLDTSSVAELATSLDRVLRDVELRHDLERSAADWLYCRRWDKMAARVLDFLYEHRSAMCGETGTGSAFSMRFPGGGSNAPVAESGRRRA